jgi:ribosomal protein S18 acetylase RimI-like enzyme
VDDGCKPSRIVKEHHKSIYFIMITIRTATPDDAPAIISFQQAMAMETEGMELKSDLISRGVMAVFHDPNKGQYYVAEELGRVVASLMITFEWSDWRNANIWWFQSVYVIPDYRRMGIFRLMYEHVKKEGMDKGIAGLRLYVESENVRAQKTYEAMGMNGSHYRTFEWMV